MKRTQIGLVLILLSGAGLRNADAQGTAFTYQGRLSNNGGLASGSFDLTFTLFGTNAGGSVIAGPVTNSATQVSNGLFAVTIDFGEQFNGNARWLEIAARTNAVGAFITLTPRQALTPTPYAIMAESASNFLGALPPAQLSGTYSNQVIFDNGGNTFDGSFYGQFFGASFIGGNFTGNFIGTGSGLSDVWHTGGNLGTSASVNFLGTTDNQPLLLKVNGQQVMRYEPTTDTPNVVGGWSGNSVLPGLNGVTIGGGGTKVGAQPNTVAGNGFFATIAGGYNNAVTGYGGAVLSGSVNLAAGSFSLVGSGQFHTNLSDYAVIVGGIQNLIQPNNYASLIGGGNNNTIQPSAFGAIIGGGNNSTIQTNADHAIIAGGWQNLVDSGAYEAVIGGGAANAIGPTAIYSVIGGGNANTNLSSYTFLGAGNRNQINATAGYSAIAGGEYNTLFGDAHTSTS